ncbi:hypothetical protein EfmJHP36_22600 [Enterococcus faecium]|nr:hypothetical protein EfmJHP36_22600 [Enterococcus faecium]
MQNLVGDYKQTDKVRFSIDIHPGRKISKQIQHLTGITNQRVQKAPYFEDVAQTIYNLLADTIFVAHNIYFDYNFLNHELMRCGLPSLKIPGIDTVELAQIFLPTEPSFRLADLSEHHQDQSLFFSENLRKSLMPSLTN